MPDKNHRGVVGTFKVGLDDVRSPSTSRLPLIVEWIYFSKNEDVLGQSEVVAEEFASNSDWIQNDKECVAKPGDDSDVGVHQVESVVWVTDDLGHRPGE